MKDGEVYTNAEGYTLTIQRVDLKTDTVRFYVIDDKGEVALAASMDLLALIHFITNEGYQLQGRESKG